MAKAEKFVESTNALDTAALNLLKRKDPKLYSPNDLVANMMRSKLKDSIFKEEVKQNQQLVRAKINYEIIKDNYRNKATYEILRDFTIP